ncbi:unnamed protein product, partial [Rotaria magnacalcarata]
MLRIRDGTFEKRKNPSKIIADLTTQNTDEQQISPSNKLQKQLSVQDTIQRHFSQILKNDSITVTDNTTITETLLMRETNSAVVDTLTSFSPLLSVTDNYVGLKKLVEFPFFWKNYQALLMPFFTSKVETSPEKFL